MKTYKIYWREYMNPSKTGENLIKASNENEAKKEFQKEYPINVITNIINCSNPEYQTAYDNEQFDMNGRRKF